MTNKKRLIVWLAIFAMILGIISWKIYYEYKLRQSDGWKDAHPTKERVNKWLLKNFDPAGCKVWNKNPKLEGPEFDTGATLNQEFYLTPLGEDDWGIGCYSWKYEIYEKKSKARSAQVCRLKKSNDGLYMFIKHRRKGQYGVANLLQGWAHSKPPPFNHYIPPPLEIANKKIILSFDLKINTMKSERRNPYAWQFVGATIWFVSPKLKKNAVVDLMVYTNSNILYSKKAKNDYRYQRLIIEDSKEAFGKWRHYDIDVSWFIADMLKRFNIEYAAGTLKLYSLEILCETMFGECGFYTRNVYLYYK